LRPLNSTRVARSLSIRSRAAAPALSSRMDGRLANCGRKAALRPDVHDQKRWIVMALTVAGFVTGGTKIDTTEAVDVSYPGFFQHDDRKAGGR
jgi:hypothetical protein